MTQKSIVRGRGVRDKKYCIRVRFSQSESIGLVFPSCDHDSVGFSEPYHEGLYFPSVIVQDLHFQIVIMKDLGIQARRN
jgi:hypothetical protein